VLCNELHSTPESARKAPTGRMDLSYCKRCGHYFNRSFDPNLMYYSAEYETSLYASKVFRDYADALVERLISTYDIREKQVLEIGSGRGEFLRHLCTAGSNSGIGFDTSTPIEGDDPNVPGVRYVRDYFSSSYDDVRADLIVCQQVLEHVEDPRRFLRELAATSAFNVGNPVVYFEVPNGHYTAKDLGIWDLIYEHVSYFSPSSLRRLFEECGFLVLDTGTAFGDQYLYIEARVSDSDDGTAHATLPDSDHQVALAFAKSFEDKLARFRSWAAEARDELSTCYVWGAGSKGITFCNLVDPDGMMAGLIDSNTAKHGKYIAGTGGRIQAFEGLDAKAISTILIMNPQYREEIAHELSGAGSDAGLVLP
jgi:SAM-dependent methyltransferase